MNITDVWLTVKEQYWYDVIKTNIRKIFLIRSSVIVFSCIWIIFTESYYCLFISYLHIRVFCYCMCGLAAASV